MKKTTEQRPRLYAPRPDEQPCREPEPAPQPRNTDPRVDFTVDCYV